MKVDAERTEYRFTYNLLPFVRQLGPPLLVMPLIAYWTTHAGALANSIVSRVVWDLVLICMGCFGLLLIAFAVLTFVIRKPTLIINERGVQMGTLFVPWRFIRAVGTNKMGSVRTLAFWPRDFDVFLSEQPPNRQRGLETLVSRWGVIIQLPDILLTGGVNRALSRISHFCEAQIAANAPASTGDDV